MHHRAQWTILRIVSNFHRPEAIRKHIAHVSRRYLEKIPDFVIFTAARARVEPVLRAQHDDDQHGYTSIAEPRSVSTTISR